MKKPFSIVAAFATFALLVSGCQTAPKTENAKENLQDEATASLRKFERGDPSLEAMLNRSYGYAIFPSIGKGGAVVGGAYGRGVVYEKGQPVGYCDMSQASVGFQLGGQSFAELIVFETKEAVDKFRGANYAFSAEASAVALKAGGAAQATFKNGVAVFTMTNAGLMYEAAIAGQRFTYSPM